MSEVQEINVETGKSDKILKAPVISGPGVTIDSGLLQVSAVVPKDVGKREVPGEVRPDELGKVLKDIGEGSVGDFIREIKLDDYELPAIEKLKKIEERIKGMKNEKGTVEDPDNFERLRQLYIKIKEPEEMKSKLTLQDAKIKDLEDKVSSQKNIIEGKDIEKDTETGRLKIEIEVLKKEIELKLEEANSHKRLMSSILKITRNKELTTEEKSAKLLQMMNDEKEKSPDCERDELSGYYEIQKSLIINSQGPMIADLNVKNRERKIELERQKAVVGEQNAVIEKQKIELGKQNEIIEKQKAMIGRQSTDILDNKKTEIDNGEVVVKPRVEGVTVATVQGMKEDKTIEQIEKKVADALVLEARNKETLEKNKQTLMDFINKDEEGFLKIWVGEIEKDKKLQNIKMALFSENERLAGLFKKENISDWVSNILSIIKNNENITKKAILGIIEKGVIPNEKKEIVVSMMKKILQKNISNIEAIKAIQEESTEVRGFMDTVYYEKKSTRINDVANPRSQQIKITEEEREKRIAEEEKRTTPTAKEFYDLDGTIGGIKKEMGDELGKLGLLPLEKKQ